MAILMYETCSKCGKRYEYVASLGHRPIDRELILFCPKCRPKHRLRRLKELLQKFGRRMLGIKDQYKGPIIYG